MRSVSQNRTRSSDRVAARAGSSLGIIAPNTLALSASLLSPKRRLPVLSSSAPEEHEPRARWQWIAFGAGAIALAWVPLAYLAVAVIARVVPDEAAAPATLDDDASARLGFLLWAIQAATLAVAGAAGGYLLGRYGDRPKTGDAAASGALVSTFAVVLSWARTGFSLPSLAAVGLLVPMAMLGARMGRSARDRGRL